MLLVSDKPIIRTYLSSPKNAVPKYVEFLAGNLPCIAHIRLTHPDRLIYDSTRRQLCLIYRSRAIQSLETIDDLFIECEKFCVVSRAILIPFQLIAIVYKFPA